MGPARYMVKARSLLPAKFHADRAGMRIEIGAKAAVIINVKADIRREPP